MTAAVRRRRAAQIALVLAVAIGVLGFEACTGSDDPDTSAPTEDSVPVGPGDAASTSTDSPAPTGATANDFATRGAVVKVANASGYTGSATRLGWAFERVGFAVADPTDAAGWEVRLDRSKVYFLPSSAKPARQIARVMGVEAYPMPTPVPIVDANTGLGDATIVVMLGRDLADQAIPGLTDR